MTENERLDPIDALCIAEAALLSPLTHDLEDTTELPPNYIDAGMTVSMLLQMVSNHPGYSQDMTDIRERKVELAEEFGFRTPDEIELSQMKSDYTHQLEEEMTMGLDDLFRGMF